MLITTGTYQTDRVYTFSEMNLDTVIILNTTHHKLFRH